MWVGVDKFWRKTRFRKESKDYFLKHAISKFVRGLKIKIGNYQLPEIKRQNYN